MHDLPRSGSAFDLRDRFRRLIGGCFAAFAIVMALAFFSVWFGMRSSQEEARRSVSWPTASGTITVSEIVEVTGIRPTDQRPTKRSGPAYRPQVEYTYEVAGTEHTGTRIEVFMTIHATEREAEARISAYPVGASVPVHHDPERPERAVLEVGPESFDNTYFFAFGGGFLAILVVLAFVLRSILRTRTR